MGRDSEIKTIQFKVNGEIINKEVETFTWGKLIVLIVKSEFGL